MVSLRDSNLGQMWVLHLVSEKELMKAYLMVWKRDPLMEHQMAALRALWKGDQLDPLKGPNSGCQLESHLVS